MSNQATLTLPLYKMRHLKVFAEYFLEKARNESDGSPESKITIEYKRSILSAIESAIAHAEITD